MVDNPEGRASDFDDKIPDDERDIQGYMEDRWGAVLPQDFIDQVAPIIDDIREAEEGEGMVTTAEVYYDPDADAWRDPDTGQFIER